MDLFSIAMFVLVGVIAGHVANKITYGDRGLLLNVAIGVTASVAAGVGVALLGMKFYGVLGHMLVAIAVTIICFRVWRRMLARRA